MNGRLAVIERERNWAQAVFLLVSFGIVAWPGSGPAARAQEAAPPTASPEKEKTAAEQVVSRLQQACAAKPALLGVLVQKGELADGVLKLTGTLDRKEQAAALEAEARQLLDPEPAWKAQMTGGASAAGMPVLPVRSELLPKLRQDLAAAPPDEAGRPGLLRQTRLDDMAFDSAGRLAVTGLCVNHEAYLASQKGGADPAKEPRAQIAQGLRDRLKAYPLPEGVDPAILDRIEAGAVDIKEDPAHALQSLAESLAERAKELDDIVFVDARFDAGGALVFEGLLGKAEQRETAAGLVARTDILRTYARPGGKPPCDPAAAVRPMVVIPWRTTLMTGLQERLARPSNKGTELDMLRYCRVDRVRFAYPDRGGLQLRFEGVALFNDDQAVTTRIATELRDDAARLFQPQRPFEYNVINGLKAVGNPRRALQEKVAAEPSVDGVRVDDLTIGPKGESTLEGIWVGESQAQALDAHLLPVIAEQTGGKVGGPLVHHFTAVPSDQLLRDLRARNAEAFDETSLDRLSFQLPGKESPPVPTLMGGTPESRQKEVSEKLAEWLKADARAPLLGAPTVSLAIASRPGSLLNEVRTQVANDPALDGVRVDRAVFDVANVLNLSGRQDHEGQSAQTLALLPAAARKAWGSNKPLAPDPVGAFAIVPLKPKLKRIQRLLPYYRDADGVLITRAFYRPDLALTFGGRSVGIPDPRADLEHLVQALAEPEPGQVVKLGLKSEPRDPARAAWLVSRGIECLARCSIASVPVDTLDEAVFLEPDDSAAWYLRAAYYYVAGDHELAVRDLARVKLLEAGTPTLLHDRYRRLTRFQGPLRITLEELELSMASTR
jgi:hypothetical protein